MITIRTCGSVGINKKKEKLDSFFFYFLDFCSFIKTNQRIIISGIEAMKKYIWEWD